MYTSAAAVKVSRARAAPDLPRQPCERYIDQSGKVVIQALYHGTVCRYAGIAVSDDDYPEANSVTLARAVTTRVETCTDWH